MGKQKAYLNQMRINLKPDERITLVRSIFSQVAGRYDLLNHLLSLGQDVFWRRAAARRARIFETGRILDLASGTGDLALALAKAHPGALVMGADFTWPMLVQARAKSDRGQNPKVSFSCADALVLPFADASFDSVTMAFGIRNIPDRQRAFGEMLRVLTAGGRALILELTFPRWSFIRNFYQTYLTRLIPRLGGLISGQTAAYQYLADSILDFPDPVEFQKQMMAAGFDRTGFIKYTFGIAVLHWGEKR